MPLIAKIYCLWACISIALALMVGGYTAENITRASVIFLLLLQLKFRTKLSAILPQIKPHIRFITLGVSLAALVEGLHMISKPVFDSIQVTPAHSHAQAFLYFGYDLAFTVPAYLGIFQVIWWYINRYQYSTWEYILLAGLGQVLGDGGGIFFLAAIGMLLFLPYPMSNYHAINIIPFLAVEKDLPLQQSTSWKRFLIVPSLIVTYLFFGSLIQIAGLALGFK